MPSPTRHSLRPQALVIAIAASIWCLHPVPALWALAAAYGVAWLVVSVVLAVRPKLADVPLRAPQAIALLALLVVPAAVALARQSAGFLYEETLLGFDENLADHLRLERTPTIAPAVVATDQPQIFYVHAPGGREVWVRFGPRGKTLPAVDLGAGLFRLAYDPRRDGEPHTGDGLPEATLFVDGASVQRTITVVRPLAHPRWLRPSADRQLAATVSEETDALVVIDSSGLARRTAVGDGPTDCAFVAADRVAVAHRFDDALWLVDPGTGSVVAKTSVGGSAVRLAISPSGRRLAVALDGARRGVVTVAVPSMRVETFSALEVRPDWIAFGPDDDTLMVSSRRPAELLRLRGGADGYRADGAPLALGRPAVTVARSPDGKQLLVATTDYRPEGGPNPGNHFIQDQILTVDVAALRVARQWLTARRSARQSQPGDLDQGVSPMGIDVAADGTLFIAFAGTDEVWQVRPDEPVPRIVPLDALPLASPHGIARFADGAFVVSSPPDGSLGVFAPDGRIRTVVRLAPDDDALLHSDRDALARRMGEHDFYEATRAGVSCQSCHLHADSDGAMHDVGDHRLSPTLSVRGVAGTAPYLRDASYPRVRDLDDLARTLYRGYLRQAPGRAQTLEAYVAGLVRLPGPTEIDVERERAGVRAFVKARCPTCHTFPAFTNLGQHPMASLFPDRVGERPPEAVLDTPSLLSVRWAAPYLSDGRAPSLRSVLDQWNPSNRHGDSASLSATERDDLVYFLESL
jgi:DNA-binding beta-propeller fold protein YncE